jgi:hypothetical protein
VASAIEHASVSVTTAGRACPERSSLIDLDELGRTTPASDARIHLFREVLRRWEDRTTLTVERQVERAAKGSTMLVSSAVRSEITRWIEGFLETERGFLFANGNRRDAPVSWSIAWPPDAERPTVFRGTTDWIVDEGNGVVGTLVVEPPDVTEGSAVSELRIALGSRSLLKSRSSARGWIVRLGDSVETRSVPPIGDSALERLIDRLVPWDGFGSGGD